MNNCTDYMLSDLLEGTQPEVDLRVFCGGPLGLDRLYFVHTLGSDIVPGAREYSVYDYNASVPCLVAEAYCDESIV